MRKFGIDLLLTTASIFIFSIIAACSIIDNQSVFPHIGPQAGGRTYAKNYKDMILAICITTAYQQNEEIGKDVGSSISALRDWTYYDMDEAPDAIKTLVNHYLAQDYHNPLVDAQIKNVRFDFLKCLDMYHSKVLDEQVKRLVMHPNKTYRQEISGAP